MFSFPVGVSILINWFTIDGFHSSSRYCRLVNKNVLSKVTNIFLITYNFLPKISIKGKDNKGNVVFLHCCNENVAFVVLLYFVLMYFVL